MLNNEKIIDAFFKELDGLLLQESKYDSIKEKILSEDFAKLDHAVKLKILNTAPEGPFSIARLIAATPSSVERDSLLLWLFSQNLIDFENGSAIEVMTTVYNIQDAYATTEEHPEDPKQLEEFKNASQEYESISYIFQKRLEISPELTVALSLSHAVNIDVIMRCISKDDDFLRGIIKKLELSELLELTEDEKTRGITVETKVSEALLDKKKRESLHNLYIVALFTEEPDPIFLLPVYSRIKSYLIKYDSTNTNDKNPLSYSSSSSPHIKEIESDRDAFPWVLSDLTFNTSASHLLKLCNIMTKLDKHVSEYRNYKDIYQVVDLAIKSVKHADISLKRAILASLSEFLYNNSGITRRHVKCYKNAAQLLVNEEESCKPFLYPRYIDNAKKILAKCVKFEEEELHYKKLQNEQAALYAKNSEEKQRKMKRIDSSVAIIPVVSATAMYMCFKTLPALQEITKGHSELPGVGMMFLYTLTPMLLAYSPWEVLEKDVFGNGNATTTPYLLALIVSATTAMATGVIAATLTKNPENTASLIQATALNTVSLILGAQLFLGVKN